MTTGAAPDSAPRKRRGAAPSCSPRPCRRCWSPPNGSPPPSRRESTGGGGSAAARPSGSSASTSPAIPATASTGANRPSRSASSSARRSGRPRRACGCGATGRARWATAPRRACPASASARPCCCWPPPRCWCAAAEYVALLGRDRVPFTGRSAPSRLAEPLHGAREPADSDAGLPPRVPLPRHARLVLVGDFLSPLEDIDRLVRGYGGDAVTGHLLQVLDPAEEAVPVRRPHRVPRPRGRAAGAARPRAERARRLSRAASARTVRALPISPAPAGGRSPATAPTGAPRFP